jgi:hypothetical protein
MAENLTWTTWTREICASLCKFVQHRSSLCKLNLIRGPRSLSSTLKMLKFWSLFKFVQVCSRLLTHFQDVRSSWFKLVQLYVQLCSTWFKFMFMCSFKLALLISTIDVYREIASKETTISTNNSINLYLNICE